MKKIDFSAVKWLEDLRFSGDKKELVAQCVVPEDLKVTVSFNGSTFDWDGSESKFFKLGATPGTEIVVILRDNDSTVSKSMVAPGKQYVRMSSNSVSSTREKMLNNIFAGKEVPKELLPFIGFLRDGVFHKDDERLVLEYIKSSNELSSLALGILLLGMHENGVKDHEMIRASVNDLAKSCLNLNLFELSLLSIAVSLNLISTESMGSKLESSIKQQLELLDTSDNAEFSLIQFAGLINLYEFSADPNIKSLSEKLINAVLKNLSLLCFDGVSFVLDSDLPAKQIVSMHKGSAQSVISCFVPGVPLVYNQWTIFLLLSGFEPSFDLVGEFFSKRSGLYNGIKVNKTTAYLLADVSLANHGVFGMTALNKTCTVFSSYYDFYKDGFCDSRQLKKPKISLVDFFMKIIYNMNCSENNNTMLYWPQDEFEKQYIEEKWVFGEVSQGRIAVHCSCPILEYNDVLINRELEAVGNEIVWSIICADKKEDLSLIEFSERVKKIWIL